MKEVLKQYRGNIHKSSGGDILRFNSKFLIERQVTEKLYA